MTRFAVLALAALLATGAHAQAVDGRLKKILDGKAISIGYRADAMKLSSMSASFSAMSAQSVR